MTDGKTADELMDDLLFKCGTRGIICDENNLRKSIQAYLLQESAPLVEALKSIGNIIGGPTMGYAPDHVQLIEREKMFNKSYEILSKAIEAFQKKHGGVV